ncbi:hypothetical protein BRE01_62570 [Brevibacillus reuszeri]|uniref:Uncharacterized protein n=1 Tax=Brevibacillus reuszeri TaxID=54915 RepID=A0A0K9YXH0_9BACL|nr:hypothetical protein [Brevibacillus reuszeri]KNB72945.1 hypothetical protein ADS79_14060 [Brevibacillus reuszeri]GED72555.1 hypothetical protein BRE01_62570 [Brevibacillus reuszeri]
MNSIFTVLFALLMTFNTVSNSVEVQPNSHESESLATYIKPTEIKQEYLEKSYRFYTKIVDLDKNGTKMSEELKTDFINFTIQMKAENKSEQFLGILISRLYVRKLGLDLNGGSADDRRVFNETASELKVVFGK